MGIIFGRDQLELRLSLCFYFGASWRGASVYVFTFLSPDPGVVGHMDAASPSSPPPQMASLSDEAAESSRHRRNAAHPDILDIDADIKLFFFFLRKKWKKNKTCRSHLTIMGSRQRLLHISRYSQRDRVTARLHGGLQILFGAVRTDDGGENYTLASPPQTHTANANTANANLQKKCHW